MLHRFITETFKIKKEKVCGFAAGLFILFKNIFLLLLTFTPKNLYFKYGTIFKRGDFLKRIFLILLAFLIIFCGCEKNPVLPSETEGSSSASESEEPSVSSEEVLEEEPEPEIFNISLVVDSATLPAEISEAETVSFEVVPRDATKMSGETLEIWEKYIAPIESAMPLSLDFDENNAPHGNVAIYTYIFYQCENLDYKYYGIEKSGYDMAESYLVDGRKTEEAICVPIHGSSFQRKRTGSRSV